MKTTFRPYNNCRRTLVAAALALSVFSVVLLGGVSVQAITTNFIWSVSSGTYTNDLNWSAQTNGVSVGTFAPCGNAAANHATNGSINYIGFVTNVGTVSYGDGGNGPVGPYSWTNFLGALFIGTNGGISQFNMTSGWLTVSNTGANDFTLGQGVGSSGTFNMSGGSLFVSRAAATMFQDFLIVGDSPDGSGIGTFTISGGIAKVLAGIEIGSGGSGTFNVNGGVLVDNGWFGVGRGGASSTNCQGTFNMTAGTMYILRNLGNDGSGSDNGLYMGQGATNAVANISGGTLYCIRFAGMGGAGAFAQQTLNMSGGTIYVGYLGVGTNGSGTEYANMSGGTFHTLDTLTNTTANLGSTNAAIFADGTNWTWGAFPTVNLTNNTFTVNGATGPGNVTFAPEATRTITLNNQWTGVGGMVISGPGSVAMGEANGNNYTGGTTVSQGTLIFNTAQPSGLISGVSLASGTILALASAQTNPIIGVATIPSGATLELNNNGVFFESPVNIPSGVLMAFNQSVAVAVTNVFTGPGNIVMQGSGTVTVSNNLQNTGWIVQSNGALVVSGTILNASGVTNNGPASAGPFCAQGLIKPPLTISSNSAIDLGTPVYVGTLNASNVNLNGAWNSKLNTATTVGGGVNDLLICSNLVLGPNSVLNILPQTPLSVGTYVLAEYNGTLTGTFGTVSNGTPDTLSVSYSTPGEVLLTVTANNTSTLSWAAPYIAGSGILWDVNTSMNWTNTATTTVSTFQQGDSVVFNVVTNITPGTSNRVSITGQVLPASINVIGGGSYLFAGTGHISGGTGISYNDTNTSGIFTIGNNFTGQVSIATGVLQLGSGGSSWLGTTDGPTVINGGTLDLDAQTLGLEPLIVQGAGITTGVTNGAINNSAGATAQSVPFNITLAGDTTLNASGGRWDIGLTTLGAGGSTFAGNGHNLTKIGAQALWLHEVGDIGVGNIDIQQGLLGFEFTVGMGIPSDMVTVEPTATLALFSLNTNSMLNKQLILNNNATLQSGGNAGASNNFIGPITLNGTNFITTSTFPLVLTNVIGGTGGFVLANTGPLYLGGVDTYSGQTVINTNSRIILMPGASIANSSLIELVPATNSVLDAGTNQLTLANGQTVMGTGYIIATNVTAGAGVTLTPGTNLTYGTLIFTNNLSLNGDTNDLKLSDFNNVGIDNDLINISGILNLSGQSTIVVTPIGALSPGNPYTAMVANGGINGSASNLRVVSTSPRYSMTPSINGNQVQVNVTGNPAPLRWVGNLTPNWDLITSNWFNLSANVQDHFYNGDDPIFDDSSTVTTVTITNSSLLPAGIFMSNVVKTYTFNGNGNINGQLNMYGNGSGSGGMLVLAMSNTPAFTTVDTHYGSLVYNLVGLTNYTVKSTFEDTAFTAAARVIFGGTNTALVTADNLDAGFDGEFLVTNGVFRYTGATNFGSGSIPLAMTNNGTLDFNGVSLPPTLTVHIAGSGYNGEGALFDSVGNQEPSGAFTFMTMDGNATMGAPTGIRYDQHVPLGGLGQVNGNGFNLSIVGGGSVFFNGQNDGDTHLGNIDVATTNGGRLAFQGGPTALGINTDYLTIESGAEVTFYNISNNVDTVHLGVDKFLWLKGNAYVDSGGNAGTESNNYIGPVFLTGTNTIGTRYDMHFWGAIMDTNGPGGFILGNASVGVDAADLWLDGTNSYSGATIISNRTLHVGVNSSLGLSTYVGINSGAALDLSAMPVVNFGTTLTNQTMIGAGTVTGPTAGNLNFNAGGTLIAGLPTASGSVSSNIFTLTMNNSVVLNVGSTNYVVANKTNPSAGTVPVGKLAGLTSLTLGGTIVVTNFGTSYLAGDTLPIFSAATITTNTYTIVPATPGQNLAWNISTIPTDGTLRIASTLVINPNPTNIVFAVTNNNQMLLSWPADHTGWQLQAQTNKVSVGISTNWANVSGSTTTNAVFVPISLTNGCVFYRLIYAP